MSDQSTFKTFPSTEDEALALLYLHHQDLTGLSPEEVYVKYRDAYIRFHKCKTSPSLNGK